MTTTFDAMDPRIPLTTWGRAYAILPLYWNAASGWPEFSPVSGRLPMMASFREPPVSWWVTQRGLPSRGFITFDRLHTEGESDRPAAVKAHLVLDRRLAANFSVYDEERWAIRWKYAKRWTFVLQVPIQVIIEPLPQWTEAWV